MLEGDVLRDRFADDPCALYLNPALNRATSHRSPTGILSYRLVEIPCLPGVKSRKVQTSDLAGCQSGSFASSRGNKRWSSIKRSVSAAPSNGGLS